MGPLTSSGITPPRTAIAAVWTEVLGSAPAEADEDFLAAGGDSIQAAALLARLLARTGVKITLQEFVAAPTVSALAALLDREAAPSETPDLTASITGERASYAQERFWFIDQASGSNTVSNVSWAVRLRGSLDADALDAALDAVAARHESLRTRFVERDGVPVQVVDLPAAIPLERLTAADEAAAAELAAGAAGVPFDLGAGPLLRAQLIRLGADDHVLHFVAHHIVCDDWSKGVLMAELGTLAGGGSLDAEPVQYPAYSRWQRERIGDAELAQELTYWQGRLAGAPPALELPTDAPRPGTPSLRGTRLRTSVPTDVADSLRALGRAEGATFFMTLLAALEVLLLRYTAQEDLVIGTAVDNRGLVELEQAVGLYTNVLALRGDASGRPTFRQLLTRAREATLDAIAHQDLPFDRLAAVAPERDPSRHPVFQAFYEFIVPAPMELPLPGVSVEAFEVPKLTAEFDLALYMDEQRGGLDAVWEYATDLYHADTIDRLAAHFLALLAGIASDPDRPIDELPLLSPAERAALDEWNETGEMAGEQPVHERFASIAARRPGDPALVAAGMSWSYGELDRRANQYAHRLRTLGAGPGDAVGISLPRTGELIAAMLGILKAGAAYVPLNPDHPPARVLAQLQLAGAEVLVSDAALDGFAGAVLAPDDAQLDLMDDAGPLTPSALSATAYVLFTSGSTGVPKGVAVTHGNLANYTEDMIERLGADGLQFGSVSAVSTDLGNTAIFPALAGGGCLHLVPAEVTSDAGQFAAYVAEHPLDVVKITPSHLATLLDAAGAEPILPRRWLVVGGEAFTWSLAERLLELGCAADGSGPRVLNHYGPTETTVGCCTYELRRGGKRPPSATVPIGFPITGDTAHVLDTLGEPVPVGVPGELVIGGAGVARGYVGDLEKTAAVFEDTDGERRYHTGDLARRLPTGELEFLGRADQQVKIRGYRIEPAEVAAVLERRGEVAQAAVLAVGDGEARRLVAFVVRDPSADDVVAEAMRTELAQELPAYMIPSAVVPVAELPLTPSGKLDRARLLALQAPEATPGGSAAAGTSEELTGLEGELAGIWQELLEHQVGPDDNFFEAGGHSLLAIRLVARLRGDMGVKLSLKALIDAPTIRLLAEVIEAKQSAAAPTPAEAPAPAPPTEPEPEPQPLSSEPEPAPGEAPPVTRVPRDRPLRSSFIQEQLWLVDQLTPGSAAYNFSWPMHVRGALDVPALERALTEFVHRHEAMRTRLVVRDEQLAEAIDVPGRVSLTVADLSTEPDPESAALRQVAEATAAPFDLATGPLYRFSLIRIAPQHHVFQVVVHHAVFDGVSKVVLYEELGRLYDAYAAGTEPGLEPPAVQYADFAEWQRDWLTTERLSDELQHWREQLADAPTTLEIPGDRSRPAVATLRGARLRAPLPTELRSALENLARAQGATFFTAALAAYAVLLARYSGQEELVVGAPVDTRSQTELAHVVGPFINTVVLRTDLSGSPSFRELLRRVQLTTLDAIEHQALPFERLVEALAPERDLSRHPIFQALLALNPPEQGLALGGLTVEDIDPPWASSRVDLFLVLDDLPTGMEAIWEYSTDLFDPETVDRMASHFTMLLQAIVADPDRPADALELLSERERERLTGEWNQTTMEFPGERLETLIAAQAARMPDATAVVFEDRSLTYAELDARANQLAHRLRELGVDGGDLVGICLPRSEQVLVALLGTLKAGAAYVPIDPAYPPGRQRYMLEDADVAVLITESGAISDVPAGPHVLRLDAEAADLESRPATPPASEGDPDDLAYVIYTSGSTGRPKGVEIPHRALVNFLTTMAQRPGLTAEDRLVAVTTLSFDIAGLELYLPLVTGARVVIAPAETAADPAALAALLQESGATVMQATPTTWRMLVDSGWSGVPGLKALCGGEALPPGLADELIARGLDLWNMYGPTETTIWSTCAHLAEPHQHLTIGRPIGNTSLYILDRRGAPAPIGVPGELLIGGAGLARGYRNRPELTEERFIPDPFSSAPGARLYRTGDLARYRPDGNVEYLGRLDHQIKLRGFRIELGEIESRLAQQPSVSAAAATVHISTAGEPALSAYVVPSGAVVDLDALRRALAETLPSYMVPSSLIALDSLPLTPNGKVDRNALPTPEDGSAPGRDHVAPRTPTEEAVAGIWREVLGIESVGVTDDFFDLGGQSLLAVRLIRRIEARFDIDLSVRRVFEDPTVAGLSHHIAAQTGAPDPVVIEVAAPRTATPQRDSLPALTAAVRTRRPSYAQERFWFIEQVSGGSSAYNIAWPLRLRGRLDVPALQRALTEIIRRHEVLRTRFVEQDGRPVALVDPPAAVALAFTDLTGSADPESALRTARDAATAAPFDIAAGPVLRAELLRLGEQDHVLQVVVHHIVADGGSKAIFFAELAELYETAVENRPSTLAEPLLQYGDFAEWQVSWLEGERLERELSHWTEALAGAPTALELPADRQRPPVASLRGAWHRQSLPPDLLADLQAFAQTHGLTLFMVLLGGFEVLLHRYSRQTDLLVGTPVDTRSRSELEAVIGPFVNSVVVRSRIDPSTSARDLLMQGRDRTLDAIEHQELPFERLVETLAPDRDLSRHPIFQAQIALNPPEPPIALTGLAVEELDTAKTTSRVDLTLLLQPQPGGLDTVWEYSTDLFDSGVVEQMAEQFVAVLRSIVADPETPVQSLALVTESQHTELVARSTRGSREFETSCLHERFEAQAKTTPDGIAVTYEERSLSYGELNARANRVARLLRGAGVEPDTLVALSLERSLDLVVAILAVLKAGGAYLPLDPEQPADRVDFILRDSSAPVLVTTAALLDRLPPLEARIVCLDRDTAQIAAESSDNLAPVATPDHLAYVIYTSGSTGQPKGVEVEHRQVARLFAATESWLHPGPEDTWTLLHSYAFDFSVWELWGALLHGGRLVVVPAMTARTPDALARLITGQGVTIFNATPSLFLTAVDDLIAVGDDLPLRYVIFGGEALQPRLLRDWFDRFGDTKPTLVNMYGITETTVHVTYRPLTAADADRDGSPIGDPLPDLQLYLLDDQLVPVPVGIPGELYVGGAGVTRGYLNRPELTAERFIANPFGSGRLYRTSDQGRWSADGNLLYEGRLDDQVKIRGFRIELGEIQSVLSEHPDVDECAVITRDDGGGTQLAAYVVPANGADGVIAGTLREWLRGKLPEYMVPATFTLIPELPLTANGKLDRRALPEPTTEVAGGAAPASPTERALAEIFAELLGDHEFSVDDDFFAIGGHSLLAAQLIARIRARFEVPLPVRAAFESPTIAELARAVDLKLGTSLAEAATPKPAAAAPESIPRRRPDQAALSYSQQQLWLIDQWDPGTPTYNVALPFRVRGPLDLDALASALRRLINRHEVLRTVVEVRDDEPLPVLLEHPALDLQTIDLRHLPQTDAAAEGIRLATEASRRPFDFTRDPLLRATVVLLGTDDTLVGLETHHIAFDGWSERLLLDELATLYRGEPVPDLPIQFADFAVWQREWLSGLTLDHELDFWRRHLAGAKTSIELPADHPRPEGRRFRGESLDLALDRADAEAAAALMLKESVTPYMLGLAALSTLLYRITGQDDILIGSPAANRSSVELETVMGFVSNTLTFRVRLAGNPTFRELLHHVRDMALDVYSHQGVPLEKVVEAVRPEREPGVNPLFQVNLRVSGSRRTVLDLRGTEITPMKMDSGYARFDLALDLDVLADAIEGYFRYNRDIFEPATIAKLAAEFRALLQRALTEPDTRLLSFGLTEDWAGPARPSLRGPRQRTIIE